MRKVGAALLVAVLAVIALVATVGAGKGPPDEFPGKGDPAIKHLGKAFDKDGRIVEGIAIIHYKKDHAKGASLERMVARSPAVAPASRSLPRGPSGRQLNRGW